MHTRQFTHTNFIASQLSESLETAINAYSGLLLELPTLTTTDEIEYAEKELHALLSNHGNEVRQHEQPVIQLLMLLADSYTRKRIIEKGIDPLSREPFVNLEDCQYSF
jgi:hypothetical protein